MDFDRSPCSTRGLPAKEALGPGDDDADSGGAGGWWVWDNIIPDEGGGITKTAPNPMSIIGPAATMPSLAASLNWELEK